MPQIGIAAGVALVAVAAGGYLVSEAKSFTAFIPAGIGLPLILCSIISLKPKNLKMGMHIAATLGLLGFIAPAGMLISKAAKGALEWKLSTYSMLAMGVICLLFVLLCVKSFVDVRKAKKAAIGC